MPTFWGSNAQRLDSRGNVCWDGQWQCVLGWAMSMCVGMGNVCWDGQADTNVPFEAHTDTTFLTLIPWVPHVARCPRTQTHIHTNTHTYTHTHTPHDSCCPTCVSLSHSRGNIPIYEEDGIIVERHCHVYSKCDREEGSDSRSWQGGTVYIYICVFMYALSM